MHTKQPLRPLCSHCHATPAKPNGRSKLGFTLWHRYCVNCSRAHYDSRYRHMLEKDTRCSRCGFVALDPCQLDLVYVDGNRRNRSAKNLCTLCANCHRLWSKDRRDQRNVLDITGDAEIDLSTTI